MPYRFRFIVNGKTHFECAIPTLQCFLVKQNGERCRSKTAMGTPYCWQHLRSQKHVRVKQSTIQGAGKGLFADNGKRAPNRDLVFKRGDQIVRYFGEVIDKKTLDARYGDFTAPYAITYEDGIIEDAACKRGVGALVNQAIRKQDNNAELTSGVSQSTGRHVAVLLAIKDIHNGDEIFADYGDDYVMNEAGVSYKTTTYRHLL